MRVLTALTGAAVLLLTSAAPTWADGGFDPVNCNDTPTAPECVVDVVVVGGPDSSSAGAAQCRDIDLEIAPCYVEKYGWNGADGCYYKPASASWSAAYPLSEPGAWYEGWCGNVRLGRSFLTRMVVLATPPGQGLLVQEAVRRLQLPAPVIRFNPAPPAAQLVFVPTWMWLEDASWGSRSATASVPGLSVTATATAISVQWSMGDGTTITCLGPGTPWVEGTDPLAPSPSCGHTFTRPSVPGMFAVAATVTWQVSWVGGGASGAEPALNSTATVAVTVAEAPTVNTGTGG